MAIKIILSSANMGNDADEADFDAWASYVCDNIDEACGVDVAEVDQYRFGDGGEDAVSGGTDDEHERVRHWLARDGWEAFCATPAAWPQRVTEAAL